MKKSVRILLVTALACYCLFALPAVLLLLQSEYYRFQTWQELSRKAAHVTPTKYVFCGDSITASGRNWGLLLGVNPLSTMNEGFSGALIRQVKDQVEKASMREPRLISVMAGTNDVHQADFNLASATNDFREILQIAANHPEIMFTVTSLPETREGDLAGPISELNKFVREESSRHRNVVFIDLNAAFSKSGKERAALYEDNVHLSAEGLRIWAAHLRGYLK